MDELSKMTAGQMVSLLKEKEITPLDLIDIAEQRINAVDGTVNAMPTVCFDRAREHARQIMDHPPADPPGHYLYGLPIAVKDLCDVKGVRTTYGSLILKDNIAQQSDILVQVLEKNGAIVVGKSNTPEFGAGGNTFNEVFGATLNPWNTDKTCGGSSGGSAVALATGQVWLATGSDLGGSLRIPASFCSVIGLRPSPGRIASGPRPFLFDSMGVDGPMGRCVRDVALMLDAQAGHHPADPLSLPAPAVSYREAVDHPVKPAKVAYSPDLGAIPVDPEVAAICRKAAESFSALGVAVEEVDLDLSGVEDIFNTLRAFLFTGYIGRQVLENHRDKLKPEVIWNIEKGLNLSAQDVAAAEIARAQVYQKFYDLFGEYDVLLCPTVLTKPFDVGIRYLEQFGGKKFDTYVSWLMMTFAITVTSCPAISVPCGFSADGLPIGLQMVTAAQREDLLLSTAALFEDMAGLHRLVPVNPRPAKSS
jgi:amidase